MLPTTTRGGQALQSLKVSDVNSELSAAAPPHLCGRRCWLYMLPTTLKDCSARPPRVMVVNLNLLFSLIYMILFDYLWYKSKIEW